MGQPQPLVYLRSYQTQFYKEVGVSMIRTRIVRVVGEHADHLTTTTTTAPSLSYFLSGNITVRLVSNLTELDSTKQENMFFECTKTTKSKPVILGPTVH